MEKTTRIIRIPYKPRKIWKETIYPALARKRFAVVVGHRRFGKTVGSVNYMIKEAIINTEQVPQATYLYIAPTATQARRVSWNYFLQYTSPIPGVTKNEKYSYFELPNLSSKKGFGSRIYVLGAENQDALRGVGLNGVILDEFGDMREDVWSMIIRPALSDRKGWALFIGTPKGQNAFYNKFQEAQNNDDYYAGLFTIDDTDIFDEDEIKSMKSGMTEEAIRQELYCDFSASAFNILITIDHISKAKNAIITQEMIQGQPLIYGIDVARFGNDKTVLFKRRGLMSYIPMVWEGKSTTELISIFAQLISQDNPSAVFIDAGQGAGVIDGLRSLGFNIMEVPFGSSPINGNKFVNKRAEMWSAMRDWFIDGGFLPSKNEFGGPSRVMNDLFEELTSTQYMYDARGRIQLESKDHIKTRMGKSPDIADALCLTFANHVRPKYQGEITVVDNFATQQSSGNMLYDNIAVNTKYKPF